LEFPAFVSALSSEEVGTMASPRLVVTGASLALALCGAARAGEGSSGARSAPTARGALRTNRLSARDRATWNEIVAIVRAEDRHGRPRCPTLRLLWDVVEGSQHVVYVEMAGGRSYLAGRFEVISVDPEGRSHEARLLLNPSAIDRAAVGAGAARASGFVPFQGLGRTERYAEVLGHELAHAVWHLSGVERARLGQRLQSQLWERTRRVVAGGGDREEGNDPLGELERAARRLEVPAQAIEAVVWRELRESQSSRE
jgi:hypothetical protein